MGEGLGEGQQGMAKAKRSSPAPKGADMGRGERPSHMSADLPFDPLPSFCHSCASSVVPAKAGIHALPSAWCRPNVLPFIGPPMVEGEHCRGMEEGQGQVFQVC